MKKLNLLFAFIFLISSCTKNPVSSDTKNHFSIHFLKDQTIEIDQLHKLNLADVVLVPKPWLSSDNIKFYDYSTHFIYLKTSIKDFFPDFGHSSESIENWHLKPFVVCAYNKPCYAGCLIISICTAGQDDVYISDPILKEPEDILKIRNETPFVNSVAQNTRDVRNNSNIKKALVEDGIYHGGLDATINNVSILKNADTATVQYSFTITNNDQDDLYVFDSDVIEEEIRDLSVRLAFKNESDQALFPIGHKYVLEYEIFENWKSTWFTKIGSGCSITRTVIRKYPGIPAGHYYCILEFLNQFIFNKDERKLSDGRYWLGCVGSEFFEIDIE
jgi:hypothetical protein